MRLPKSVLELRARAEEVRSILDSTAPAYEALEPIAHLIRAAIDTRRKPERIKEAVRLAAPLLVWHHRERKTVGAVRRELERSMPMLALDETPCDKAIGRALQNLHADDLRTFGTEVPHQTLRSSYASGSGTT
jgi:hypothetical protein